MTVGTIVVPLVKNLSCFWKADSFLVVRTLSEMFRHPQILIQHPFRRAEYDLFFVYFTQSF